MKNFKSLLVALFAVACLGLGVAVAQNITKAIQLSQDPSGAFGVDTSNNLYIANHVNGNNQLTPTIATAAGTAATISGTDLAGVITGGGASSTTVTVTFRTAYGATPACVVQSQNPATSPVAYTPSTTAIAITSNVGASIINYVCFGIRA